MTSIAAGPGDLDHLDPPLRMDGVAYSQVALRPPFNAGPPPADEWRLYIVQGDGVMLDSADMDAGSKVLARGTVIGVSGHIQHRFISANFDRRAGETGWVEAPLGTASDPGDAVVAISRIAQLSKPFVALLPSFIRIDPEEYPAITGRIGLLIGLTAQEIAEDDIGSQDVIVRLAEIITMQLRRVARVRGMRLGNWPEGLAYDSRIWRAMSAVSSEPQRSWTVESMADVAGMSRSVFAARYRETVGQTPMRSLRRLRLQWAAANLMASGPRTIATLAGALGYASEEAFNRAFTKEFGYPPRRYRQRHATRDDPPRGTS